MDLKAVKTQAVICVKRLDSGDYDDEVMRFCYDNELRMIDLYSQSFFRDDGDYGMHRFFVPVPLPFQKGDILRTVGPGEVHYGVMSRDADETYFRVSLLHGDSTDMNVLLDVFSEHDGSWMFDSSHFDFLQLERCSDEELPKEQSVLKHLSAVYRGEMEVGQLLYMCSNYGKMLFENV